MQVFDRAVTSKINWLLENVLPPMLRDNKKLMRFVISFAYGRYTDDVMDFKDHYPELSDADIDTLYCKIADAPINKKRQTDLNRKCTKYIADSISGNTVLDVACGRGYMAEKLSKAGYSVTGVDVVMPKKHNSRVTYVEGKIEKLPFGDGSFNTVICTHALEHIRDYKSAISEIIRVTDKRLIVVMPRQREYKYTPDLHVNFCPYMYRFKSFLIESGVSCDAHFFELGGDFVCDWKM